MTMMRCISLGSPDIIHDRLAALTKVACAPIYECPRCKKQSRLGFMVLQFSRELRMFSSVEAMSMLDRELANLAPKCDCALVRCRIGANYQRTLRLTFRRANT